MAFFASSFLSVSLSATMLMRCSQVMQDLATKSVMLFLTKIFLKGSDGSLIEVLSSRPEGKIQEIHDYLLLVIL